MTGSKTFRRLLRLKGLKVMAVGLSEVSILAGQDHRTIHPKR